MSHYDLGYILGVSHSIVWYWEHGLSFPHSVVLLKRLGIVFPSFPGMLKELSQDIVPERRYREFTSVISCPGRVFSHVEDWQLPVRFHKDERDTIYKRAFGSYLRRERLSMGLSQTVLADGLGTSPSTVCQWESGIFPRNASVLSILDRLYGNLFDVLFGLCRENGIHLKARERRDIVGRMDEIGRFGFRDVGKPKPLAWQAYMERRKLAT